MEQCTLLAAIEKLQGWFQSLNRELYGRTINGRLEKRYRWPGGYGEEVLICVHKSSGIRSTGAIFSISITPGKANTIRSANAATVESPNMQARRISN